MSYAFYFMFFTCFAKLLITFYKPFEKYVAFTITFAMMIAITERNIYLEPSEFKLSYINLTVVGFIDYYNALMTTPLKFKNVQNCIIWTYYVLRNLSYYGHFPPELLREVIALLVFQQQTGTIYNSYVESIKE